MSACEMLEKIKSQELSSQEIVEIIIERIEKVNPIINAFCTPTFDIARENAKTTDNRVKNGKDLGLLEGIPTSIKDEMQTKGIKTTFGSKLFENSIPDQDDLVVKRLKNAGMVMLGKTNLPEFGFKGVTDNLIFGVTKNPWDISRTPGGSSGGAAASIASGLGQLALGADGGGSIRIPSSFCGLYGLKPSFGRIPQSAMKTSGSLGTLVHYGPIVRYVEDAALMLDVMAGEDDIDRYSLPKPNFSFLKSINKTPQRLKIGFSTTLGFADAIDSEVEKSIIKSAEIFQKLDWTVEETNKIKIEESDNVMRIFWTSGFAQSLGENSDNKGDDLAAMVKYGSRYSVKDIKWADIQREKIYTNICNHFKDFDILITPTLALPAFELGKNEPDIINGKDVSDNALAWLAFTYIFNLSGHPAASIPCGWTKNGLPIGMQIIGRRLDDLTVLRVSKAFEELAPWQHVKPVFD